MGRFCPNILISCFQSQDRIAMKIVLLDSFTLNPGDLGWEPLEALGEFVRYDRTDEADVIARADGAEVILSNKTLLSRETIFALKDLRYIGVLATGYNVVDADAAKQRRVILTNVPAYSTDSVAQTVFAHILAHTQHVSDHSRQINKGRWTNSIDFSYWDYPLIELAGLTMGIVGFGQIGRATERIARAFGMKVLVHSRSQPEEMPDGVEMASLEQVFSDSDVVSIHCPLTDATDKLVDGEHIGMMKASAILINTSRGGVIDEQPLADALNSDQIAGAGLDVLSTEPPKGDNPLLSAKNCTITPHIAWATKAARQRCLTAVANNIAAFQAGKPVNVVNM